MGVLMEHSQDVKCVAWHPTEEVSHRPPFRISSRSPAHQARSTSADPRIGVLRRHHQALPRRSFGGLVLLRNAQRARVHRVVTRVLAGRPLPRVELGRSHRAHMGARAGAQVGVR